MNLFVVMSTVAFTLFPFLASTARTRAEIPAAPTPFTRLEEQLVVGAANALSHDVRYVCRGTVENYRLTESPLSEWVMERLRRHRPALRGCDSVRFSDDWFESTDHLWIGPVRWYDHGRLASIDYAPEQHSMGFRASVQAQRGFFGRWRFVAPTVFE